MNKLTARAVQGTVQFIFFTLIAACIFVGPAALGGALSGMVAA